MGARAGSAGDRLRVASYGGGAMCSTLERSPGLPAELWQQAGGPWCCGEASCLGHPLVSTLTWTCLLGHQSIALTYIVTQSLFRPWRACALAWRTYSTDGEDVPHGEPLQDVKERIFREAQQAQGLRPPADPALGRVTEALGTPAVNRWDRQGGGCHAPPPAETEGGGFTSAFSWKPWHRSSSPGYEETF